MLFNSYEFIFIFLPIVYLLHLAIARTSQTAGVAWLVLASLFFYGWWNPRYLALILLSMAGNFVLGQMISRHRKTRRGTIHLCVGIALNLGALVYYKYAGFIVWNWNALTGWSMALDSIVLPLAISFFTFQQIAYLVDAYRGITEEYKPLHYALFVTFFPQLIAGPIVHHREVMPQFVHRDSHPSRTAVQDRRG